VNLIKKNNSDRLFSILVIFAPLLYWGLFIIRDRWIESRDTMHLFYVTKRWVWSRFMQGELPLWNDGLYGGFYQLASPAIAVFSPVTAVFYTLFDSFLAEQLQFAFFAVVASWGAFRFARFLKLPQAHSLLLALSFAFGGVLLSLPDRSPFYFAFCLYPLCLDLLLRFTQNPSRRVLHGLGVAAVLSLIVMNGDWAGALVLSAILPVALFFNKAHWRSLVFAWPLLLCVGLTAVAVWPVFENLQEATRAQGLSAAEAGAFSFHPLRLLSFFLPEVWGYPFDQSFWGQKVSNGPFAPRFWYHSIYMGSLLTVLAFFGLRYASLRSKIVLSSAVVFFLLLGFGIHGFLHEIVFQILPPYRSLRYPEKFILFVVLGFFVLATIGLREVQARKLWPTLVVALVAWHGLAILALQFAPGVEDLIASYQLSSEAAGRAVQGIFRGLLLHVVCLGVLALAFVAPFKKHIVSILIFVSVTELIFFAPPFRRVPAADFEARGVFTDEMQKTTGRFISDMRILPFSGRRKAMLSNWPLLDGLRDMSGYDTVPPWRLMAIRQDQLFKHMDVWSRVMQLSDAIVFASPRDPDIKVFFDRGLVAPLKIEKEMNLALLRWTKAPAEAEIFTSFEIAATPEEALQKVIARGLEKGAVVLEQAPSSGVFSGGEAVGEWSKLASSNGKVSFAVTAEKDSIFVHRGSFHKGWRAYIDEKEVPVFRADSLSRAVVVPSGQHEVRFEFSPPLFQVALWISMFSVIASLMITGYFVWRGTLRF